MMFLNRSVASPNVSLKHIITQFPSSPKNNNHISLETADTKDKTVVLVPSSFEGTDYENFYKNHVSENISNDGSSHKFIKYSGSRRAPGPKIEEKDLSPNKFDVYDAGSGAGMFCSKMKKPFEVQVTKARHLDDIPSLVQTYLKQRETDSALSELNGFITENVQQQLDENLVAKHWYKFAGSTVWLEEHGVHLMVSRVVYSGFGNKKKTSLSLAYAQVYDEQWNELQNIELLVPDDSTESAGEYRAMSFPCFLPVPFYHDDQVQKKRNYGPEDPRLVLVKNKRGVAEPLMVYNSFHRKLTDVKSTDETHEDLKYNFFRLMFVAWPLKTQLGKDYVMGQKEERFAETEYIQAVELLIENEPRKKIQKNWTPFVSEVERSSTSDDHAYFVYRWDSLEVLKCSLTTFVNGASVCHYDYKKDEKPDPNVGALRGGTQMLSLRSILPAVLLPRNKEVWVGFARANIVGCGCGQKMYRPNLAVMTKEDGRYVLSQLGSFTSLNVEVRGLGSDKYQCGPKDYSVLIPNGISGWNIEQDTSDTMTLTVSVADDTVEMVHIQGILTLLLGQTSMLNFDPKQAHDTKAMSCCMDTSKKFCKAYGLEQVVLGTVDPKSDLVTKKSQ